MRRILPALAALAAACATSAPGPERPAAPQVATTRAVQLARVRCLLVTPLENASDEPLAAEAATAALVSAIDQNRTRVYPIEDLRALFHGTSLELPDGVSASLALELGELVAADAVLYGSVEGRARGPEAEVTLTVRLAATGVRDTLFSRSVRVQPHPGEALSEASRRAALEAAAPILERMGIPGKKACFERQRLDRLRVLAAAGDRTPPTSNRVTEPLPPPPPPVGAAALAVLSEPLPLPPPPPDAPDAGAAAAATVAAGGSAIAAASIAEMPADAAPVYGNRRQAEWAAKLAARERFAVEDVTFAGRSPRFERQTGLVDLAAALGAQQGTRVRIEGFVDAGKTTREDEHDSMELARAAGRRLIELGVSRDRVTWAGRGREAPIAPNFTVRGRETNRRVEVVPLP